MAGASLPFGDPDKPNSKLSYTCGSCLHKIWAAFSICSQTLEFICHQLMDIIFDSISFTTEVMAKDKLS
jgi:hypothetical protein